LLVERHPRIALAVCVVAPLVKLSGTSIGLAAGLYVLSVDRRRWRSAALFLLAAAVGLGLVAAYGAIIDWSQFVAVYGAQAGRHHASVLQTALTFLFSAHAGYGGDQHPFNDPLWYGGLASLGIGVLVAAFRLSWMRLQMLLVPVLVYTVVIAFTAPTSLGSADNGWYRLAVYPLVYAAVAWLVVNAIVLGWRALPQLARRQAAAAR
ncbi:MAG: hypothetical protein ABR498_00050, partial [Candidatus Dormibacteria bacterium]